MTNECDVLIAIGMRFDDRVTGRLDKYAKQAKVIHLDIDPAEIDKNVKTTVPVWGNCKKNNSYAYRIVEKADHSDWLNKFRELEKKKLRKLFKMNLILLEKVMTMGEG